MKTSTKFLCICLVLSLKTSFAFSQARTTEVRLGYPGTLPPAHLNMNQKIDDRLFLVYNFSIKGKAAFIGYDDSLKEVFRIDLENYDYYPQVSYNKEADQILVIGISHKKAAFNIAAKIYDTKGKLVKQEDISLPGKASSLQNTTISEDGRYFAIFQKVGKKEQDILASVYDFSLSKKLSKEMKAKDKESFIASKINSQGAVLLASSLTDEQMAFYKLDLQGQESQITAKKSISGKEVYDSYLVKVAGDRLVLAAEKNFRNELTGIDIFDVDFATRQVNTLQSIEFNAENVKKMYDKVNEEHIINKSYSLLSSKFVKPEHLASVSMQHLIVDKERICVVSESIQSDLTSKQKTVYFANDILITAFTSKENSWNSVIGRTMFCGDPRLGLASLLTSVYLQDGRLQVLTSEYKMKTTDDVSSYLRTVDMQTGMVSAPRRLIADSFWTNSSFTSWLKPNQLVLFSTSKVKGWKDYSLRLVMLDEQEVQ